MDAFVATEQLGTAHDRWQKAKATADGGWRTKAKWRDQNHRLMGLHHAISVAEHFRDHSADEWGRTRAGNHGRRSMSNIDQAATWLATTPDDRKPHPLVPYLQKTFGLTAGQAIAAIREAHLKRARAS